LSSLFLSITESKFSFQINNIVSPPSPATTDRITITTTNGTNDIDTCSVSVTGLTAKPFLSQHLTLDNSLVNTKNIELTFDMTFSDKVIANMNTFSFIFPLGSSFSSSVSVSSVAGTVAASIVEKDNQVIVSANFNNNK
jgi:hypothetical protein